MCVVMCKDMCIDMCMDVCRHVYDMGIYMCIHLLCVRAHVYELAYRHACIDDMAIYTDVCADRWIRMYPPIS